MNLHTLKNTLKAFINKKRLPVHPFIIYLLLMAGIATPLTAQQKLHSRDWKLGIQAWSFHAVTFAEALDKIDSCGVKYVEGIPNQLIGGGIKGKMDYHMDAATRQQVLDLLDRKGIRMVSYGVVKPKTDSDWVQLFKFAKAMHLETIVSEPRTDQIPLVSRLCDKYQIGVAVHNHARPTHYWSPEIVLAALKNASPRIGVCADIGHWLQSDLDPVECLKKLEGHIMEFHMKDLNEKGTRAAHDVPMGAGVIHMDAIMQEMKRQQFKGYSFIEYEYHWKTNLPEVKACVDYFDGQRKELLK
jgi:sugar phosphate isomerase/epimerase